MNKQHKCIWCEDTGMANNSGLYMWDCAQPGCTAAVERTALDDFVKTMPYHIDADIHWAIHQRAIAMCEAKLHPFHADAPEPADALKRRMDDR